MYSDQALLDKIQRERNPPIADVERENAIGEARIARAYRPPETPHEYVMRILNERKWLR